MESRNRATAVASDSVERNGQTIRPFVVAFNRNRDFYQVPLALQEDDLLSGLVTDVYSPPLGPLRWIRPLDRLARRRVRKLPFNKVRWSWPVLRMQLFDLRRARDGAERAAVYERIDQCLSRAALKLALHSNANLFLYGGYAREAFEASGARDLKKGLFVFHPHGRASQEILGEDVEKHPEVAESHRWHMQEILLSDCGRLDAEIAAADFLVCASSFTKRSLGGIDSLEQPIRVAPYGAFRSLRPLASRRKEGPARFLFVGQGVQRKGLHHLLKVWRSVKPTEASLTIVAAFLDPNLRPLADQPNVTLLHAQSARDLQCLYDAADILVMPSLVEGFGLVYLEALSAGCFTIGTENTGLPDLNLPEDIAQVIPAGDLAALRTSIDQSIAIVRSGGLDREKIRRFADALSWEGFRQTISDACRASAGSQRGKKLTAVRPPAIRVTKMQSGSPHDSRS